MVGSHSLVALLADQLNHLILLNLQEVALLGGVLAPHHVTWVAQLRFVQPRIHTHHPEGTQH